MILRINLRVVTDKPQKIWIIASDPDQSNTVFTNRYNVFTGEKEFYVRMPMSPKVTLIQIYNEANGNQKEGQDKSFVLVKPVERLILERKTDVADINNTEVRNFVQFGQRF